MPGYSLTNHDVDEWWSLGVRLSVRLLPMYPGTPATALVTQWKLRAPRPAHRVEM